MDPFTAISLAGSIIQFIECGLKLVSTFNEVSQSTSGTSREDEEIETQAESLKDIMDKIATESATSKPGSVMLKLAAQCETLTNECMETVKSVKMTKDRSRSAAFLVAMKKILKREKLKELQQRLDSLRGAITGQNTINFQLAIKSLTHEVQNTNRDSQEYNQIHSEESKRLRFEMQKTLNELKFQLESNRSDNRTLLQFAVLAREKEELHLRREAEHWILNSLKFNQMEQRLRAVKGSHTDTFKWILSPEDKNQENSRSEVHFREWLEADQPGSKIFWVAGKPGSGKSTLMKYIWQNPDVDKILCKWAKGKRLVKANYFFWAAGSSLERSKKGLLRAIIYQVLRRHPEMIEDVCDTKVTELKREAQLGRMYHAAEWEEPELQRLLTSIIERLGSIDSNFFFFIDALDEYEGIGYEIVETILDLAKPPNVKLCISSRPLGPLTTIFQTNERWKVELHEHTVNDIKVFVKDTLIRNATFGEMFEEVEYQSLVSDVVKEARGVFLWVTLVVRLLLEGISIGARIDDLRSALHDIPGDLEDLYDRILTTTPPMLQQYLARILLVAMGTFRPFDEYLPTMLFYYVDQKELDYGIDLSTRPLERKLLRARYEETSRRVNSVSRGLIEAHPIPSNLKEEEWAQAVISKPCYVSFLHRSTKEFLAKTRVRDRLVTWAKPEFNPGWFIRQGYLAMLKVLPWNFEDVSGHASGLTSHLKTMECGVSMKDIIWCLCLEAPDITIDQEISLLADLEVVAEQHTKHALGLASSCNVLFYMCDFGQSIPPCRITILHQTVEVPNIRYIEAMLEKDPKLVHSLHGAPPLLHIAASSYVGSIEFVSSCRTLLKYGADPNERYLGRTPWEHLLRFFGRGRKYDPCFVKADKCRNVIVVVEAFLRHGANLRAECRVDLGRDSQASDVVPLHLLRMALPEQHVNRLIEIDDEELERRRERSWKCMSCLGRRARGYRQLAR